MSVGLVDPSASAYNMGGLPNDDKKMFKDIQKGLKDVVNSADGTDPIPKKEFETFRNSCLTLAKDNSPGNKLNLPPEFSKMLENCDMGNTNNAIGAFFVPYDMEGSCEASRANAEVILNAMEGH